MSLSAEETRDITAALVRMELIADGETVPLTPLTGGILSLIVRADTANCSICIKRAPPQLKVPVEWKVPVHRTVSRECRAVVEETSGRNGAGGRT